jgi:DNA-binding transcriptional ArsR family regulator
MNTRRASLPVRCHQPAARTFNQWVDNCLRQPHILNHMVESLDVVFHALSSGPRRSMLGILARGEHTVGDLADPFDISLAAVSKHLKVLEGAGLVERQAEGRTTICRLRPEPLADVRDWVAYYERFWTTRLDRLERLLTEDT